MSKHEYDLPGFDGIETKEKQKALQNIFRKVFSTPEGKLVLNVLLSDLRYYRPAENENDYVLCEYAKKLLRNRIGLEDTAVMTDCIMSAMTKERK